MLFCGEQILSFERNFPWEKGSKYNSFKVASHDQMDMRKGEHFEFKSFSFFLREATSAGGSLFP